MLAKIAAGGPVSDWPAARAQIIEAVKRHIESDFEPQISSTDLLVNVQTTAPELRDSLTRQLYAFAEPPFTIQRLAELAILSEDRDGNVRKQYGPEDVFKYLRALLHTASVSSTIADFDMNADFEPENGSSRGVVLSDIEWASSVDMSELYDDDENDSSQVWGMFD